MPLYVNYITDVMVPECYLCKKPIEAGSNNTSNHDVCSDQWDERLKNGMCTVCGKNKIITDEFYCDKGCGNESVQPQGYNGPQ